ncbi:hypothetical protein BDD12DRAFT_913591 [Trichophaea hybrida]|nr:hypothetical protein BDD12DRAFT_913591 [Trichophaea hybrida]
MPTSVTSVRILGGTSIVSSNTIAATSTIQDLVEVVPAFIRVPFAPMLYATLNTWSKINSVRSHIARLTSQQAAGDCPPEIKGAVKTPTIQISKEARESTNLAVTLESKYTQACDEARADMMTALIETKQEELAHLQSLIAESALRIELTSRTKTTIDHLQKDLNISADIDDNSIATVTGGPAPLSSELSFFLNNAIPMLQRCAVLARIAHDRELAKKFKAIRLVEKKTEDVVMTDAGSSNQSTKALIDESLKAFAAKFKLVRTEPKKKPVPSKKPKQEVASTSNKPEKKKKKKDKTEGKGKGKEKGSKKKGKSSGKKAN